MRTINLQTSDDQITSVDIEIINCMKTIKTILDELPEDEENIVIPLPNISSSILKRVLQWTNHHKDEPAPEIDGYKMTAWDLDFLRIDHSTLFGIMEAANYLDVNSLLESGAQVIANLIRERTTEEISRTFEIVNNRSRRQQERSHQENEWVAAEVAAYERLIAYIPDTDTESETDSESANDSDWETVSDL